MRALSIVVPWAFSPRTSSVGKAGTHSSTTPYFSSNSIALPTTTRSCRGEMAPGLRRGDEWIGRGRVLSYASLAGMTIARSVFASFVVALALIGAGTPPACAQEATEPGGMQIFVTPYLWLAGINSTIATPLARAPEVNSSVGAFQLLGHLDGVPFMGSAEIRDGPLGLLGDVLHVPVGTNITTRNVFFQGGNAALQANTGTLLGLYRVLEAPTQYADLGIGMRAWGFSANLTLNPG